MVTALGSPPNVTRPARQRLAQPWKVRDCQAVAGAGQRALTGFQGDGENGGYYPLFVPADCERIAE